MKGQCLMSLGLAWRDWKFEKALSLCAALALASILTPLLVLQGLKNGVVEGMRARLLEDPATLIITPKSDAGKYSAEFIAGLAKLEGAAFAIGRTRDTATDLSLDNAAGGSRAVLALEPSAPGEPVLAKNGFASPQNGAVPEAILSAPAARALKVAKGGILEAKLGRKTPEGRLESTHLALKVAGVLPIGAADRKLAFVPLPLMEDMENYRDYIEVPGRGWSGRPGSKNREYASFRLYAANLDAVDRLAAILEKSRIEVMTRAREIASIRALERAINQIILIISVAVGAGFVAFALSSAMSAAERKKRMLAMLRLLGFRRLPLLLYPLAQAMFTAIAGFALALGIYYCVAFAIASAFADQGALSCQLGLMDICVAALGVSILSLLASCRAAWLAANSEPSMALRET